MKLFGRDRERRHRENQERYLAGYRDGKAQGYDDGKAKAFGEVELIMGAGHARDCGCRPCGVAWAVWRAMVERQQAGVR